MTTTMTHVAKEDLMALADGELSGAELLAAQEHVDACAACAAELRESTGQLRGWTVEAVPDSVDRVVLGRLRGGDAETPDPWPARRWVWGVGGGAGALAMLGLTLFLLLGPASRLKHEANVTPPVNPGPAQTEELRDKSQAAMGGVQDAAPMAMDDLDRVSQSNKSMAQPRPSVVAEPPATSVVAPPPVPPPARAKISVFTPDGRGMRPTPEVAAPMIAREVALGILVQDVGRAREGLDGLLRAYNGYAAEMEVKTPDGGTRSLHASLRVPAGQLRGLLAELKGYGKVDTETQSGEEVGQQHADLAARLSVARESEARLRAILRTRAGDVADVLQVEEEIARVRGEIEGMDAEQLGLEHRVNYSTVTLDMYEHDPSPTASPSVWSRLGAAVRAGGNNALGAIAFLLEYGLATLLVLAILFVPAWFVWRRWRKVSARW